MDASGAVRVDDLRGTDLCPDCIERDDVHVAGYPRPGRRGRIRHCMGCGGSTRVPRQKADIVAWWVAQKERVS